MCAVLVENEFSSKVGKRYLEDYGWYEVTGTVGVLGLVVCDVALDDGSEV